jgi:hypothetical protein
MLRGSPPARPEPECAVCGSADVAPGSAEDGAPLCVEHDHPVRRERIPLEDAIAQATEAIAHITMRMSREAGGRELERLERHKDREVRRRRARRERLEELQKRCDHAETEDAGPGGEACALCGVAMP